MTKTLEAHDKRIMEIFKGDYQFHIPHYQRPYAWTTEQAQELLDDLLAAMQDARGSKEKESQYFLGSVVLIKKDRDAHSEVVDGQQRLTTLTILFSALRTAWRDGHDEQAIRSVTPFLYQEGDEMLGQATGYRLVARKEDAEFFRKHIQEPGGLELLITSKSVFSGSELRYNENAKLLLTRVRALSADERHELWRFLVNQCSLVVITTPDLEAAYRIFSVLNNRGLDLAPLDILKAEILRAIHDQHGQDKAASYAKKWSGIEKTLGREGFGDLLVHIRTIYAKQKQRATLVKEFQEYVSKPIHSTQLIDDVLVPYAAQWDHLRHADFKSTEQAEVVNDYLTWLNLVEFKDWVPPALVFFKRFHSQPALLAEFLTQLERLTYFLLITKAHINQRIDDYAALTRQIETPDFQGDADQLLALKLSESKRAQFLEALDGNIYESLPRARRALILRLEALFSDGSKVLAYKNVSIEHVLPRNPEPKSEWLEWFAKDDERELWTHRLANLVPLHVRKNSAASNADFKTKKGAYFLGKELTASPFVLTNEVRAEAIWNPKVLEERQQRLLGRLTNHWRLGEPS